MPSCSCPDFTKHLLPCKHFFAAFQFDDRWDWTSLPAFYLSSPYMSIDWTAIYYYFTGENCRSSEDDEQDDLCQADEWLVGHG